MMKKHGLKLTLLLLVGLVMSCSNTGVGSYPEAILKEDNFIYKEYLDNEYYKIEIINIEKVIDSLDAVLVQNPKDEKAKIEKEMAEDSRSNLKANIANYADLVSWGIIGPVWPCDLCLPSIENLKYIVTLANSQVALGESILEVAIYNASGDLISKMDNQFKPLLDNEKNVSYANFNLTKSYSGPVFIKVIEKNIKGEIILDYMLEGYIEDKVK
ncbi:hypothetical protein JBL43_03240 [Aureibaculum sp. A20]|uniref:Lipoprotein n=1 Tax=Aureibaculum flavum TaxID=2795986 RepID=A0ABS0WMR9_9FLAO|nr:hypothetical protein [Aureibaculum flavum]MBJ2173234.1 hypothetical protein [Aureibaculum flavum]